MDNHERLPSLSRDEYIRLARESCTRNLSYNNGNVKSHATNKNKSFTKSENFRTWDQGEMQNKFSLSETGLNMPAVNLKSLLIRTICALILFLGIFIIDKFNFKVNAFDSKYIQDMVTNNQTMEDTQNFFVALFEDFVKAEE